MTGTKRLRNKLPGIPPDVRALVERYAGWTYQAIATDLAQEAHQRLTRGVRSSAAGSLRGTGVQEGPQPREPKQWIEHEEEAQTLAAQISQAVKALPRLHLEVLGVRPHHVQRRKEDVYVVDVLIESVPTVFASAEQFQDYLEQVRKYCVGP